MLGVQFDGLPHKMPFALPCRFSQCSQIVVLGLSNEEMLSAHEIDATWAIIAHPAWRRLPQTFFAT